jgi:peptidoglycan/xylan/chitin deacetylase (PgdA/CDA1 family)
MSSWPFVVLPALGACAGVAAWGAVSSTSQLFGPTVHHTAKQTPQVLKLLERYQAPASFFVIGRFARECPELVREVAARGHSICNHTETHVNLTWLPPWQIADELRACQDSILRALGVEPDAAPRLMRPPFGYRGPQLWSAVRNVGLDAVAMWSLKCYDWKPQSAERLIERLGMIMKRYGTMPADPKPTPQANPSLQNKRSPSSRSANTGCTSRRGGEIVLLHDGDARKQGSDRRHVLAALEHWLPRWRDAGFEFVTMNQVAADLPAHR